MGDFIDRSLAAATVYNTHRTAQLQAEANAQMSAMYDLEQQRVAVEEQQNRLRDAAFDAQSKLESLQHEENPHQRLYLATILSISVDLQGISAASVKSFSDKDWVKKLIDGLLETRQNCYAVMSNADAQAVDWCARMIYAFPIYQRMAVTAQLLERAPSSAAVAAREQKVKLMVTGLGAVWGLVIGGIFFGSASVAFVFGAITAIAAFFVDKGNARKIRNFVRQKLRPANYMECVGLAQRAEVHFDDFTDDASVRRQFSQIASGLNSLGLARSSDAQNAPTELEMVRLKLENHVAEFGLS